MMEKKLQELNEAKKKQMEHEESLEYLLDKYCVSCDEYTAWQKLKCNEKSIKLKDLYRLLIHHGLEITKCPSSKVLKVMMLNLQWENKDRRVSNMSCRGDDEIYDSISMLMFCRYVYSKRSYECLFEK